MRWQPDWGLRARMAVTVLLLLAVYAVFVAVVVSALGGGVLLAGALFASLTLAQYLFSHRLTLWSMGAREVEWGEYPTLYATVERLAGQADLPTPTVAVADTATPNAFATGRSRSTAVVCVTEGLLETLPEDELAGVVAHELAHIRNRDMAVMTVASLLSTVAFIVVRYGWLFGGGRGGRSRGGSGFAVALVVSLLVWVVSFLLVRALSRYREFAADRGGALLTGDPAALAGALRRIDGRLDELPEADLREQAELNAFFVVPITRGFVGSLFRTHPPTEARIERLLALERELETAGGSL